MLEEIRIFNKYFIIIFVLCCLACSTPNAVQANHDFSLQGFQQLLGVEFPISFVSKNNDQGSAMTVEYLFNKTRQSQYYIIDIHISARGTLLVESDYLAKQKISLSENSQKQHRVNFPSIGSQAQYTFLGAGPGGVSERIIFTTSNKKNDVSVIISHLLPSGVELIPISLESIATYVDETLSQLKLKEK